MDLKLCPKCENWRCHPQDRFCGHCGAALLRASAVIDPPCVYEGQNPPDEIKVEITNAEGGLGGTQLLWRNSSTPGEEAIIARLGVDELNQPGEKRVFSTDAATLNLESSGRQSWDLVHCLIEGYEIPLGRFSSGLVPPQLSLRQSSFELVDSGASFLTLEIDHESGDLITVHGVSIISTDLAGVTLGVDAPALPVELDKGQCLRLKVQLTNDFLRVLRNRHRGIRFALVIETPTLDDNPQFEFLVRIPSAARPRLSPPASTKAISGRTLHIALGVENDGGSAYTIGECVVRILGVNNTPILSRNLEFTSPVVKVDIGQSRVVKLDVSLIDDDGTAVPPRPYKVTVEVNWISGGSSGVTEARFNVDVRPPTPFKGSIAVDFGTTATAAAVLMNLGRPFQSIPLDSEDMLIPSAIAYFCDSEGKLNWTIGKDARKTLDELEANSVTYLDNMKTRLTGSAVVMPDGSTREMWEVARDYLSRIKLIIEDHPDVTALVNEVCVTQPAQFKPASTDALLRAYAESGLQPRVMTSDGHTIRALSESWPTATLGLPLPELKDWQNDLIGNTPFIDIEDPGTSLILSFDMGGGTTDVSLLELNLSERRAMTVRELATFGTEHFCGNAISRLIYQHVWPSCAFWLERKGYDPARIPIQLPWEPIDYNAESVIAGINGRKIAETLIYPLQHGEVDLAQVLVRLEDPTLWNSNGPSRDEVHDALTDNVIGKAFSSSLNEFFEKRSLPLLTPRDPDPINLPLAEAQVPGGLDGAGRIQSTDIGLDLLGFLEDFIVDLARPVHKHLHDMFSSLGEDAHQVHLLITGRGSNFPLVRDMLTMQSRELCKHIDTVNDIAAVRVHPDYTKTLVSTGACYIEHLLPSGSAVRFIPKPLPRFGIGGIEHDPATGFRRFLPISRGMPAPEDGPVTIPYPLPAGRHAHIFNFFLLDEGRDFIHSEVPCDQLRGVVELAPEQVDKAHLVVTPDERGCLHVSIGIAPPPESTDLETWRLQPLGYLSVDGKDCGPYDEASGEPPN